MLKGSRREEDRTRGSGDLGERTGVARTGQGCDTEEVSPQTGQAEESVPGVAAPPPSAAGVGRERRGVEGEPEGMSIGPEPVTPLPTPGPRSAGRFPSSEIFVGYRRPPWDAETHGQHKTTNRCCVVGRALSRLIAPEVVDGSGSDTDVAGEHHIGRGQPSISLR